jgi:hypothetical protein
LTCDCSRAQTGVHSGDRDRRTLAVQLGRGQTSGDVDGEGVSDNADNCWQTVNLDQADASFMLRAERLDGGDGRVYTITYRATDQAGHTTLATAVVTVPKNSSGK